MLTPQRWQQINQLLGAALEMVPEEWSAFLAGACAGDEYLRGKVESLLAAHDRAGIFIEASPAKAPMSLFTHELARFIVARMLGHNQLSSLWTLEKWAKDSIEVPGSQVALVTSDNLSKSDKVRVKFCPRCQRSYPRAQRFCTDDNHLLSLPDPYYLLGRTLADKYLIEALVGLGGMGAVYSALHLGLDRRVAFKILQPNLALTDERIVSLFEREAKIAGHLKQENITDVKDAGRTTDGIAYIVMEWLDGHTLEEEFATSGFLSLRRTANSVMPVARNRCGAPSFVASAAPVSPWKLLLRPA